MCDGIEETFEQARTVVEEGVYVLGLGELRKRLRREEIGLGF
jgi:hypothetical protein